MADGDFGGFDDAEDALEPYQPTPLRASFAAGRTEGLPRGASQPRQFERGGGQRDDADWDDVPRYGNSQRQRGQNGDYGGYGGDPRATQGRQLAPPEGPRATPRPGPSQPMRQGYDDPQMNMRNGFDGRGQEAFQPSPHRTPNGAFLPEVRRGPPREDTLRFLEHWQQNPQSVDRRASFRGGATGSRNSSKRQSHVGTDRFDHYSSEDERPRAARAGTRGRGGGGNRNSRETPMSRRDQARYEPDLLELAYGPGPGPLRTPAQHYVQRPRPSGAPGNQGAAMAHQFPTPASKKEPSNDIYDVLYVAQMYRHTKLKKWQNGTFKHFRVGGKTVLYDEHENPLETAFFLKGISEGMSLDLEKYYVEVDAKRKKPKKRDAEAAGAQSPPKRLSLPKRNTFKPPSFVAPPPRMDEDSDSDDESREGNRSFVLEERRRGIPQPWSGMDVSRFEEQPKRRRKAQQEDDEDDRGARRPQKRRYRDQDEEEGRFREDGDARARYPPRDRSRDSRSPGFRPARHPEESPGRYEPRGDHVLVREESETDYGRYTDERGDGRNAGRSSRGGRTPAAPPKREYYRNDERERYDDRYEDERYVEGGREQEYRERRWEREESPRRAYVNDRRPEPRYDEDQFAEDRYADGDGSDRDRTYEDERNVQNRGGRREVYPEEDHDYEENEQGRRGVLQDADDRDTREWQPHEQPDGEAPFEDAGPEHDRYHDRVEGPAETKSTHGSPRRKFVEDDDGRAKPEDEEEPRETSRAARPPRKTFEFKPIEHEPTVGSSDDEELPTVEQCLARKSTSNSVDKAPGVLERLLSDRKKALGIGTQVSESLTPSHPGYLRANRTSSKGVSSDGVQDPEAGHLPMTKENVPSPNLATGRLSQARSQAPAPSKPLVEASPDRPSPAPRVSMQAKSQQSRTLAPASDDIEDY